MTEAPKPPRVLELPAALGYCRHEQGVTGVTAEASISGWLIWGHYDCDECERVAFHYVREPPDEVLVGMLRLPVARG